MDIQAGRERIQMNAKILLHVSMRVGVEDYRETGERLLHHRVWTRSKAGKNIRKRRKDNSSPHGLDLTSFVYRRRQVRYS